jgi:hypothetical protein
MTQDEIKVGDIVQRQGKLVLLCELHSTASYVASKISGLHG